MSEVTLRALRKSYGQVEVIHGVDLTIPSGKMTVLLGPSGCGKSTMLRMIAGLEDISAGDIEIGGRRVNDTPASKRGCGMVFQNYALYPHQNVFKNIAFPLKMAGVPQEERRERVNRIAKILELEEYLERLPRALSGGQRQRVAMGRAMVREPDVYLFDEPLSNLDAELRVRMRLEISSIQKRLNATMIFVTHDQVEAMTLADKIVVMREGLVEQDGLPMDIYERPGNRFVAGFVGSPAMNMLDLQSARDEAGALVMTLLDGTELRIDLRLEQSPASIGVRPEHLKSSPRTGTERPLGFEIESARLRGKENLGDRLYLHFSSQAGDICVLAGKGDADPEGAVRFCVDPAALHFFAADGQSITPVGP